MKILTITLALLTISLSCFANPSREHFIETNKLLSRLVGQHDLTGSPGCEKLIIEQIVERNRYSEFVDEKTYNLSIKEYNLHPATYGEDKHFILSHSSIQNEGHWLGKAGLTYFEKTTYLLTNDENGNVISFELQVLQKEWIFGKAKIVKHVICELAQN